MNQIALWVEPYKPAAAEPAPLRDVRWLQVSLNMLGADPALVVDGQFGPYTKAALFPWQVKHSLKPSGEMDAATIATIEKELTLYGSCRTQPQ